MNGWKSIEWFLKLEISYMILLYMLIIFFYYSVVCQLVSPPLWCRTELSQKSMMDFNDIFWRQSFPQKKAPRFFWLFWISRKFEISRIYIQFIFPPWTIVKTYSFTAIIGLKFQSVFGVWVDIYKLPTFHLFWNWCQTGDCALEWAPL